MAFEANSKQIEDFPFVPIRSSPNSNHGIQLFVFI